MSTKGDKALAYFMQGYNCAQSVFTAFHEEMGLDEALALRISSSMGGGVGGLREVCGTFSGMCMALGGIDGYDLPDDLAAKRQHYARIQSLGARFVEAHGTLICRDLLQKNGVTPSPLAAERNAEYYAKRPCAKYVVWCAETLEDELARG